MIEVRVGTLLKRISRRVRRCKEGKYSVEGQVNEMWTYKNRIVIASNRIIRRNTTVGGVKTDANGL